MFSLDPGKVRVIAQYVGGSFGGKGNVWDNTILCAAAAKAVGRPVQLALSREAVFRLVGGRAPSEQRVALGAAPDGRLRAIIHTALNPTAVVSSGQLIRRKPRTREQG